MLGTPFSPDILIDFYKPKTIPKDPQNVFSEKSQMMISLGEADPRADEVLDVVDDDSQSLLKVTTRYC